MNRPPIRCTPCRVTFDGQRYRVYSNGAIQSLRLEGVEHYYSPETKQAAIVRQEASRQRRNRASRERNAAMRDLGMKRTSYGWE